jgi:diguanylate cyclase (GGDEF)-like protein
MSVGFTRMAQGRVPFNAVAAGGGPPGFDTPEAAFNAALLREQYRSLARLGPYVHGIVIVAALALFGATPTGSLLTGILLPTALIAVSAFRLSSWFKARAGVELEALECVRRKVRAASALGPTLTFAFALTAAIATWRDGVIEFALALLAVWVVATLCAMCLNTIAGEANLIVAAATALLIVAFAARGSGLTLGLATLVAIAACFIIRMLDEHFRMFAEIVRSRLVIAEQQRVSEAARQAAMTIALTDDLTGLPNRRCFQSLFADRIRTATETGEPFALGLIDLDGFKPINDLHGHPVGDDILRQVAERLAKAMDGRGSAARIGGDEFAILCNGVGARDEAVALGKEIRAIFAAPFDVSPLGVRLSCACGFALFPSTAAEPDELVRLADAALYRAKASGSGNAAMFDTRDGRTAASVAAFENDLRRAIDGSECAGPVVDFAARTEAFTSLRA